MLRKGVDVVVLADGEVREHAGRGAYDFARHAVHAGRPSGSYAARAVLRCLVREVFLPFCSRERVRSWRGR